MHAEALQRYSEPRDEGLGRAVALAIALHVAIALVFVLASFFSWQHDTTSAAGLPVMEASLEVSNAEARVAQRAMDAASDLEPLPQPIEEVAEEDTVPPPQPVPEPVPQDSPVPQQQVAQERVPVPDTVDQDRASALAISQEKARKEQEEKRRQEQIDLTEQKRVQEAQKQQRLAKQQEEADKQKRLDEIRRMRAQAAKDAQLAEQKLRQLADARTRSTSATAAASSTGSPPAGQGGTDDALLSKYKAAIQDAVVRQWTRPDSVQLGTKCKVVIKQIAGGEVIDAQVQPGCPMDEIGKRSIEAAVLKAQPLPYRGFETVFNRTLIFTFDAQDR